MCTWAQGALCCTSQTAFSRRTPPASNNSTHDETQRGGLAHPALGPSVPAVRLRGPLGTRVSGVAGTRCPAHQGVKDIVAVKMKYTGWEEDQGANVSTRRGWWRRSRTHTCPPGAASLATRPEATLTGKCLPLRRGLRSSQEPPPTASQFPARHPTLDEAATGGL